MKKGTWCFIGIIVGGATGYLVGSYVEKAKANKRVEEIKEAFKKPHKIAKKLQDDIPEQVEEVKEEKKEEVQTGWTPDKESFREFAETSKPYTGETYHTPEVTEEPKKGEEVVATTAPYIIDIEEFDTIGYTVKYWSVFDDDIVETDDGRTLRWMFSDDYKASELSNILCDDVVYRLTEYDEDVVYCRDDRNKIDYELLKERTNYFKQ